MNHAYVTYEVGRIEDDVVIIVDCECGWQSEEIATTKYDKADDASKAHNAHLVTYEAPTA